MNGQPDGYPEIWFATELPPARRWRFVRPPFLPSFKVFVSAEFVLLAASLVATLAYLFKPGSPPSPVDAAAIALLCLGAFAAPLVPYWLLPRLGVVAPASRMAPNRAWLAFLAIFLGCTWTNGVCRAMAWVIASRWQASLGDALLLYLGPMPIMWLLFLRLELASAFAHASAGEQAALDREIERLFASREGMIQAHGERRRALVGTIADRAAPRLVAIEQELERLARDPAGDPQAAADAIERVAEEEFRRLSHMLHPSIVEMGLAPALTSLAWNHPAGSLLRVEPPAAPGWADGLPGPTVLAAYRALEAVLDATARQPKPPDVDVEVAVTPGSGLELRIRALPPDDLAAGLLDHRITEAGGRWTLASGMINIALPGA